MGCTPYYSTVQCSLSSYCILKYSVRLLAESNTGPSSSTGLVSDVGKRWTGRDRGLIVAMPMTPQDRAGCMEKEETIATHEAECGRDGRQGTACLLKNSSRSRHPACGRGCWKYLVPLNMHKIQIASRRLAVSASLPALCIRVVT